MLRHGILGLISNGDKTGYEIMTVFRDSLKHFWTAQTSQIYRELQAMEKEGWITGDSLSPKCDAARVLWGAEWRVPTVSELSDLVAKCDWK